MDTVKDVVADKTVGLLWRQQTVCAVLFDRGGLYVYERVWHAVERRTLCCFIF